MERDSTDLAVPMRRKVDRARNHISELQSMVEAFNKHNPHTIEADKQLEAERISYRVSCIPTIPWTFSLIAADAISNLISALDHLAYGLFKKGQPDGIGRHVYFPIGTDSQSRESYRKECARKVKGLDRLVIDEMVELEPYKGGGGESVWALNQLNNLAKHRSLLVVTTCLRGIDLPSMAMERSGVDLTVPEVPEFDATMTLALELGLIGQNEVDHYRMEVSKLLEDREAIVDRIKSLRNLKDPVIAYVGRVLATDSSENAIVSGAHFKFDVAIHEPGIIPTGLLVDTVVGFAGEVEAIIDRFVKHL